MKSETEPTPTEDVFFNSGDGWLKEHREGNKTHLEFLRYLEDPRTDVTMLLEFPVVRNIFVKHNTSLCSLSPAERLFSFPNIMLLRGDASKTVCLRSSWS